MKRMNYLAIVLAIAMTMPAADVAAQYTGYRGGSTTTQGNPGGRRPDATPQSSPNRPNRPNQPNRPGNDRPSQPSRPNRPGNDRPEPPNRPSRPGNDRPQQPPRPNRPQQPPRPGNPGYDRPSSRPGNPGSVSRPGQYGFRPTPPPSRPYRPVFEPYRRPVPPPAYRPRPTAPLLSAIFGLPFGVDINISLGSLRRSGYHIDGYSNDEVYLRNVYDMNYSWDDGVVIYNSRGGMQSVRLYQSTYGYDPSRYNNLYSMICSQYGLPALQDYSGSEKTVTWYDRDGSHYVSLSYNYMTSNGGYPRYYTILSYGY